MTTNLSHTKVSHARVAHTKVAHTRVTDTREVYTTALYIHIPWCIRKCPYCDFNSHPAGQQIPELAYVQALLTELEQRQQEFGIGQFSSVFFGGGTPSLFQPSSIATLLEAADARVGLAEDAEITLEANPGSSDSKRFRGYWDAGVNRLSIGIQSFDDQQLQTLGRIHNAVQARQAVHAAQDAGFSRLNLDLLYGLPGQTADESAADLQQAIALAPSHLSLYQLTIEPHTRFHTWPPSLPPDHTLAAIEQQLLTTMQTAGYERYEVSAYAQPHQQCQHNLNYWQFGDYLGLGAGAHSKLTAGSTRSRLWNRKHPTEYLHKTAVGDVLATRSQLDAADLVAEFAINALRLSAGFSLNQFVTTTGLPARYLQQPLRLGQKEGWLQQQGPYIKTTAEGYRMLNNVLELFL